MFEIVTEKSRKERKTKGGTKAASSETKAAESGEAQHLAKVKALLLMPNSRASTKEKEENNKPQTIA